MKQGGGAEGLVGEAGGGARPVWGGRDGRVGQGERLAGGEERARLSSVGPRRDSLPTSKTKPIGIEL